ncbi:hypothetical protein GCM10008022_20430 [Paenibacillus hunanensis]|uniref:HNH endonuclease n=2 Tax=Paenibacillus hunanensis TaxID=539262 RepID=A0ABU1IV76_9BACL|nr:hypothetical protein [Paenibacillus hunanensis]GGJ11189.1 hypothetical protein GCM10008022_20430 [Paenibacillus hunanensis]
MNEWRPVPKPVHKRVKKTAKQRGQIMAEVYADALDRSQGYCERCGSPQWLECAHLVRRWKLDETTVNDVAMLCGPSVNTGTCHNWVDYTAEGRKWAEGLRNEFWQRERERMITDG